VYLVAGSIPEKDGDGVYNTCTVWNPSGELVTKHQKVSFAFRSIIDVDSINMFLSISFLKRESNAASYSKRLESSVLIRF
jgi:hypothetical protein